jgi:hypothetical protein
MITRAKIFVLALTIVISLGSVFCVDPTVGTISGSDPIPLSAGNNVTVWCNATITDTDGYANVSGANATLWDPAATLEGSSDDFNNHYANSSCTLSGGSGNDTNAGCSFKMHYSANAADWTCKIIATDGEGTGSNNVATMTVNTLKAIGVTTTMTFPEQALGSTTSNGNEQNIVVSNLGNAEADISLDGYGSSDGDGKSMSCSHGTIVLANLKYNTSSGQSFLNMTALTDDPVTLGDFNLAAESVDGVASTKSVFWKIQIPDASVGGSCSGHVIVVGI